MIEEVPHNGQTYYLKKCDQNFEAFRNLQQLYEFEFSAITKTQTNIHGIYEQNALIAHWSKRGYDIYMIFFDQVPIGFSVINIGSMLSNEQGNVYDIAEFFIMPIYRGKMLGEKFAHKIFSKYQGIWEVRQLPGLDSARKFWVKTIRNFSNNSFEDKNINNTFWNGSYQRFSTL